MNEFLLLIIALGLTTVAYFIFNLKNKTFEEKVIKRAGYFEVKSKELPMKILYGEDHRYAEPWSTTKITCFRGKIYDGKLTAEEKETIKEQSRKRPRKPKVTPPPPPAQESSEPTNDTAAPDPTPKPDGEWTSGRSKEEDSNTNIIEF